MPQTISHWPLQPAHIRKVDTYGHAILANMARMNAKHTFRHRLYLILELKSHRDEKAAWIFSWVLTLMVLCNVVAVILESVPAFEAQHQRALAGFDAASIVFFSLEYLLRIWTAAEKSHPLHLGPARRRLSYMLSFHGLVDLLAILPFFLQSLFPDWTWRFLRLLRVMRILKLSHFSTALEDLLASIYAERDAFISALYLLALSILITACLMYYASMPCSQTNLAPSPMPCGGPSSPSPRSATAMWPPSRCGAK